MRLWPHIFLVPCLGFLTPVLRQEYLLPHGGVWGASRRLRMSESRRCGVRGGEGRGGWGVWNACQAVDGRRVTCTRLPVIPGPEWEDSAAGSCHSHCGTAVSIFYPERTQKCGISTGSCAVLTLGPLCFLEHQAAPVHPPFPRRLSHEPVTLEKEPLILTRPLKRRDVLTSGMRTEVRGGG